MKIVPESQGESLDTKHEKESELLYNSQRVSLREYPRQISNASSQIKILGLQTMKTKIYKKLESKSFSVLMTLLTIYALFGDDIRLAFTGKSNDTVFFSLAAVSFFFFFLEVFLMTYAKRGYRFSFYFWLDIIATISLIPDIGWLWEIIIGINASGSGLQTKKLQNAIKASRIGTRTSRVIRFIRLFRLVRIVKLYKNAQVLKGEEDFGEEDPDYEADHNGQETFLGEKLSDIITKRVILIVLVMLMILPLFDSDFYVSEYSWKYDLSLINSMLNKQDFNIVKTSFIESQTSTQFPLIHFYYEDSKGEHAWDSNIDYSSLRYEEIYYTYLNNTIAIFDLRKSSKLNGILDIARTIFVVLVLGLGTLTFSRDCDKKIVNPIKNMMENIRSMAQNMNFEHAKQNKLQHRASLKQKCCYSSSQDHIEEILAIEHTIIQIGVLLVLVFGEAGARIIRNSMNLEGQLILCEEGIKVYAIFCFCDIRNFTDVTEELQEDVMLFVNEIAYIIHKYAYIYQGAANKNIGDAFLLVWKVAENTDECLAVDLQLSSDLALLSVAKIISGVKKDPSLQKYRQNPKLRSRLKEFDIKIGFGLHMGWAIEGAVGSEYKIDPTYLSPHVNIAVFMESLTKYYGVQILLTQNVNEFLSKPLRDRCRLIDCVAQYELEEGLNVFCFDINPKKIVHGLFKDNNREYINCKKRKVRRLARGDANIPYYLMNSSKSLRIMTEEYTEEFYKAFSKAVQFYFDGLWQNSRQAFNDVRKFNPYDGPTLALMMHMKTYNFICPGSWNGVRVIKNF